MTSLPATGHSVGGPGHALAPGRQGRRYAMYGVYVESDIALPTPPVVGGADVSPCLVFRRSEPGFPAPEPDGPMTAEYLCEHGHRICARYTGPGGNWIQFSGIGTFHVEPSCQRVDVYPEPHMRERELGFVLAGHVAVIVLYLMGYPSLHAGAVVTARGGVAFLGPKGQGKSTMTAYFLRRGAALLTDDALPLRREAEGIYGAPSLPMMKLWHESAACALQLPEELPNLVPNHEKKLFELDERYEYAQQPERLRALYLLDRYDPDGSVRPEILTRTLSPREGFTALLDQTVYICLLQPTEAALLLPLYAQLLAQTPVRVLRFPSGFEHQPAVYAHVMSELEAT